MGEAPQSCKIPQQKPWRQGGEWDYTFKGLKEKKKVYQKYFTWKSCLSEMKEIQTFPVKQKLR